MRQKIEIMLLLHQQSSSVEQNIFSMLRKIIKGWLLKICWSCRSHERSLYYLNYFGMWRKHASALMPKYCAIFTFPNFVQLLVVGKFEKVFSELRDGTRPV